MTLKSPSVDNLVHWNYTLQCHGKIIDIFGLNIRVEIRSYDSQIHKEHWEFLEDKLLDEFSKKKTNLDKARSNLEKWYLVVKYITRTLLS